MATEREIGRRVEIVLGHDSNGAYGSERENDGYVWLRAKRHFMPDPTRSVGV